MLLDVTNCMEKKNILERLIIAQLVKKLTTFHETEGSLP
jgi:hypothetical protein